jgi:hypothetical protein
MEAKQKKGIAGVEFNTSSVSELGTKVKVTTRSDQPFRAVVEAEAKGFGASMEPFVRAVNNLLGSGTNVVVQSHEASQWAANNFLPDFDVEIRHVTDRCGRLVGIEYHLLG